jgi:hypothetical protein
LLLLVFATAFQLSGGYALAATISGTFTAQGTSGEAGKTSISPTKYSLFHYLNQLASQENEEKEGFDYHPDPATLSQAFHAFQPVFSLRNKHFLIHYAASIKGKLPTIYLLLQIFRL